MEKCEQVGEEAGPSDSASKKLHQFTKIFVLDIEKVEESGKTTHVR